MVKRFFKVFFVVFCTTMASCHTESYRVDEKPLSPLSILEAQAFFAENHEQSVTRSEQATPNLDKPFITSGLSPDWSSSKLIYDQKSAYMDCAVDKLFTYFLMIDSDLSGRTAIELASRLVTVKEIENNEICQYVVTYVPDVSNSDNYAHTIANEGLNCESYDQFSGLMMYTTLDGAPICLQRYDKGVLIDKVFLPDSALSESERARKFGELMENKRFYVVEKSNTQTRASVYYLETPDGGYLLWYDDDGNLIDVFCQIEEVTIKHRKTVSSLANGGGGGSGYKDYSIEPDIPFVPGGGNNNSDNDSTEEEKAPLAKALLRNSNMTDQTWETVERMIEKMLNDCMGGMLYNSLIDLNNGKTFAITFDFNAPTSSFDGNTITMHCFESHELFHELFHAYQMYGLTLDQFHGCMANLEVEAQVATYRYLKKLPECTPDSKWIQQFMGNNIGRGVVAISLELTPNGNIGTGTTHDVLSTMYWSTCWAVNKFNNAYLVDYDKTITTGMNNLKQLSKNC